MQNISAAWLYPIILIAGALQAWGPPMNGALRKSLTNPWLASTVSFLPILALLIVLFLCMPRPLPTVEGVTTMRWWAPLGGLVGSFAVITGLLFVDKIGAGPFAGLTITANILMSLAVDHFGMFGIQQHSLNMWRVLGGALMTGGIVLIAMF
ncbi:DMT family transporter [Lichenicoccus roseus]|uniref:DMT family transporter n=1 Tax=Lichenicoccus roseus TaxID=2683649 RepID=UPI001F100807|nr:DMT family transporter [Lichenicoccus roseus]